MSGERAPDFRWNGLPVYRCRSCSYERVDNLASVIAHEASHAPAVRESAILDESGSPLLVVEETEEES